VLALAQFLAALPWLWAMDPRGFARTIRSPLNLFYSLLVLLGVGLAVAAFIGYKGDSSNLMLYGRIYGAVLHLQLLIDLFLLLPMAITLVWPKGGAVAMAAYREGWRQPMFWLLTIGGKVLIMFSVIIPYFTFGDDFKMMKQIGFDIVMLMPMMFGVLAASISVAEEIEGRTAITVMSKPISRRQFLLGKFLGILMACGAMSLILGLTLNTALLTMPEFDPINKDRAFDPMPEQAKEDYFKPAFKACLPAGPGRAVAEGAGMWFGESFAHTIGICLGLGQVMILVAIATALATRLPFIANLLIVLTVYLLGHLAPVVVRVTESPGTKQNAGVGLVRFLGNLFDTLFPGLEFYNMGPSIIRETPLDLWEFALYVATVFGYAIIYTFIALLIGLLLFEDRDLA